MEIHHNISQNTLSFLVEKIFDCKVDSCPKMTKFLLGCPTLQTCPSANKQNFHNGLQIICRVFSHSYPVKDDEEEKKCLSRTCT